MNERRKINEVRDFPAELWMKIIGILLTLVLIVGSSIGTLMLNQLSETKQEIKDLGKKLTEALISTGVLSARVSDIDRRVTITEREIGHIKDARNAR